MHQTQLLQRLAQLEAKNEIGNLIGQYAVAADQGNNPQIMAQLFHEDACWQAKGFGAYQGRTQITQALHEIAEQQVRWSLHVMAQPFIEVADDAQSATAQWVLWELAHLQHAEHSADHWLGGVYHSQLRPDQSGKWRFSQVQLELKMNTAYPAGFEKL